MKLGQMKKRISTIERFVQARESLNSNDSATAMQICDQLVDTPGVEEAIRLGDVFAQLIEHYFQKNSFQEAYKYLDKMKKKNIAVTPYLDGQIVDDIYKECGISVPNARNANNDGIDEDIQEEF